jgi:F-type H+-transporting ATPase subunit delta
MLAEKYAKALIFSAKEENILEKVFEDVKSFQQILSSEPVNFLIKSPAYSKQRKIDFIESLAREKNFSNIFTNFLKLVVKKKREFLIDDIIRYFFFIYFREVGIENVTVVCADEPDPTWVEQIKKTIQESFGKKVNLNIKVDKKIIGGFEIIGDGWKVSASVRDFFYNLVRT